MSSSEHEGTPDGLAPVSIPVRVDWRTMMAAKVGSALRPSRAFLFVLSSCGLGTVVAVKNELSIFASSVAALFALALLRVVVMASASALDAGARRRFTGTLTLATDGLELTRPDGTSERHAWDWVLAARVKRGIVELRLDERGGRAWLRLSLDWLAARGAAEEVTAHLRAAGRLR